MTGEASGARQDGVGKPGTGPHHRYAVLTLVTTGEGSSENM
jgi:hypothetical protein